MYRGAGFVRKLLSLVAVAALGASLVACGSDGKSDFGAGGVKVTSDFGQKPTVTHREGDPDKTLVTEVLKEGDGPEVKKGELLTRANAAPDATTRLYALRQLQDQMLGVVA